MRAFSRRVNRFISIILSIFLIFPVQFVPTVGARRAVPLRQDNASHSKTQFRQLVIYVPDIFDSARQVEKALAQLRAKGIPKKDIINLAQHAGFDVQQGLKTQAKQLAGIVDMESAKRQGLKAYLVAKGTGGLVVRSYLATAKKLRSVGAPIENVVAVGVPHHGRQWAKLAYSTALPLPIVGSRSLAVRDLAPDSPFMRELNQHKHKREHLLEGAKAALKKIDDFTFKKELKTKLAAIDRAKIEVRDEVERILHFPERVQLSDRDKSRIREMKTTGQQINEIITVGADPCVGARCAVPLQKSLAKITTLAATVNKSNHKLQKQLQQNLGSSQLYKIKVASSAGLTDPKTNMQKYLAKISLAVSNQVQGPKINKQLDAIAEYAKQVQPDLEKEWQEFTQKAVTKQSELKRTQEKFVSTVFLRAAWDAMEQKRKDWLDTAKQYADNKAQARLEIQLESYQLQLRDQVKQMDVKVRDKQAELLQKMDSVTEKLSAQADILFANNHIGDVKQKVKEQFWEYKKAKQTFLAQAEKTKREVSDKIFRNEYFVYLKQADRMDQVLMEAVDKKTRHLQYALLGLEKGQATKEMEMFAQSSRKRLSREIEKLKNKIVGAGSKPARQTGSPARQTTVEAGFTPALKKTSRQVGAGLAPALKDQAQELELLKTKYHDMDQAAKQSIAKVKQGIDNWEALQDVHYLHKQAIALKTALPQQSIVLKKSLAACEAIQHLEKYGDIEKQLKMHTGGFPQSPNRRGGVYPRPVYRLSSQRRQLIKHIQNLADQGAQ